MKKDKTLPAEAAAHFKILDQFVPIVERVHGGTHPEFHQIRALYDQLVAKIKTSGWDSPDLQEEFNQLHAVTQGYTVPEDVCESYESVYVMLAELHTLHSA